MLEFSAVYNTFIITVPCITIDPPYTLLEMSFIIGWLSPVSIASLQMHLP